MRRLIEPVEPWPPMLLAAACVLIAMWGVRIVRSRLVRGSLVGAVALVGAALVVGDRRGLWPPGASLRGDDGLLGGEGYPARLGVALGELVRAWTQTVYPADLGEADGAAAARLLALLLVVAAGASLVAFRAPLAAVAAVAAAATISTLFIETDGVDVWAIALAALSLGLLAFGGSAGARHPGSALVASGSLLAVATAVALAGPIGAATPSWEWRSWSLASPEPTDVGIVWGQSLRSLAFAGDPVPVLEVQGGAPSYLRVAVLERFDGVRWEPGDGPGRAAVAEGEAIALPATAIAPAARDDRLREERVRIRNVGLATDALPLPIGTVEVRDLPAGTQPVVLDPEGEVRLAAALPVDSAFEASAVRPTLTPEALDAEALDAEALLRAIGGLLPSTGRYADEDPVAPWRTGIRGREIEGLDEAEQDQPGPFGVDQDDRPPRFVDVDVAEAAAFDPALLTVADVAFPAFGAPEREAEVARILAGEAGAASRRSFAGSGWARAYRLARAATAEAETPYQTAILLEDWFQASFSYDETADYLTGSPIGPLPSFLLSPERRGHCQYFAGSMATLLRMLGVPARVAVGFTAGEAVGDRRVITNRDAHAWVEVRFPRAGWVAFEPTPSRSLPSGTSSTSPSFAQAAAGVGGAALAGLVDPVDPFGPGGPNRGTPAQGPVGLPGAAAADDPAGPPTWLLALPAAAGIGGLAVLALWLAKRLRLRRALRVEDPRVGAEALRTAVASWMADQDALPAGASARAASLAASRAYGVDATAWEEALLRARFGRPEDARVALREARRETRAVLARVRGRLDRRERVRGVLRVRRRRRGDRASRG